MKGDDAEVRPLGLLADSIAGLSAFWGISESTVERMLRKGAPLRDVAAMTLYAQENEVPEAVLNRIQADAGGGGDNGWSQFVELTRSQAKDDPKAALSAVARARDFASFRFEKAAQTGNKKDMQFFGRLLEMFSGVVHDAELRAKKLGIDQGELLPRPEAERFFEALGFWLLRSGDECMDEMAAELGAASGGTLSRQQVREIAEPFMLYSRILNPLVRAAKINAGNSLPKWAVAAVQKGFAACIENGEAEFESHLKDSDGKENAG